MALLSLCGALRSLSLYAIILIGSHVIVLSFHSTNIFTGKHWVENKRKKLKNEKSSFSAYKLIKKISISGKTVNCWKIDVVSLIFLLSTKDKTVLRQQVFFWWYSIAFWVSFSTTFTYKGKIIVLSTVWELIERPWSILRKKNKTQDVFQYNNSNQQNSHKLHRAYERRRRRNKKKQHTKFFVIEIINIGISVQNGEHGGISNKKGIQRSH